MRSRLVPVRQAGLGVVEAIKVSRQEALVPALVQRQLHALDTAAEVRVEVSSDRRIQNLV